MDIVLYLVLGFSIALKVRLNDIFINQCNSMYEESMQSQQNGGTGGISDIKSNKRVDKRRTAKRKKGTEYKSWSKHFKLYQTFKKWAPSYMGF